MAQKKFTVKLSPISGSSLANLFRLIKGNKIDLKYYPKVVLFVLMIAFIEPFRWIERTFKRKKIDRQTIDEDPVFIIGHWRSGTTFLHNVLCKDPQMGYVTTYQAIYPETVLSGSWLVKSMMKVVMPKNRAADNMELGTDFPQEEEFALTNTHSLSYYNFWFFPKAWKSYFKKYIAFDGLSKETINKWKYEYKLLVKKALFNTNGQRYISKNPPNTGRIDQLLGLFPNAKFIYLYREPVTTFVSTRKFVSKTIGPLQLQEITEEEIEENILWTYKQLIKRYENQKHLIPAKNLIEIKFEDFEKNPLDGIKDIYSQLNISGLEIALPKFVDYLDSQKSYQKNDHQIPLATVNRVKEHWGFAIKKYEYESIEKNELQNNPKRLSNVTN